MILVFCEKMIVRLLLAIFVLIGSTQGAVSNIYFILILLILIFESKYRFRFRFMVFDATFNHISVISWWSVLLVEETGVPGENHTAVTSH